MVMHTFLYQSFTYLTFSFLVSGLGGGWFFIGRCLSSGNFFESLFCSLSRVDDDEFMTLGCWCRVRDFDLKVSSWWHQGENFDLMVFVLIVCSRWFELIVSSWWYRVDGVELIDLGGSRRWFWGFGIELVISNWWFFELGVSKW